MNHHDSEMARLKERLLTMAGLAEAATTLAMKSLAERDDVAANRVRKDDSQLDQMEKEVDRVCLRLLTTAPLATDLRWIVVAMKISWELERVGDEATTISRQVLELNSMAPLKQVADVVALARHVMVLLHDVVDTVVRLDHAGARLLIPKDKEIDALNRSIQKELAGYMVHHPDSVPRCIGLMTISKALERIGDHAKSIAEEVVFVCEGTDIRHSGGSSRA